MTAADRADLEEFKGHLSAQQRTSSFQRTVNSSAASCAQHLGGGEIDRSLLTALYLAQWVCLKMLCTPKPNGFADHYPY